VRVGKRRVAGVWSGRCAIRWRLEIKEAHSIDGKSRARSLAVAPAAGEEGFLHEIFTLPVLLRTPKATILVRSGDAFNQFFKAKIAEALP